jgi:hypothetical protein
MRPLDPALELTEVDAGHAARVLAEADKAYAIYIGPKNPREAGKQPARIFNATVALELPASTYRSQWINTFSGKVDKRETHRHKGGRLVLRSPPYREDIALKLTKR